MTFSTEHHGPLAVLIVDDDRLVLRSFGRTLRLLQPNWRLHTAESGAEALRALETLRIDILITDLDMPDITGEELMNVVRQSWPSILCVAHTSDTNAAAWALEHPDSGVPVLRKPVATDDLVALLSWASAEARERGASQTPKSYLTARDDDDQNGSKSA
jgi:CheY-like chemotaxis protein